MDTGIETSGGSLNWRNIISNRDEDPIVSALMKHALNIFVNANDKEVPEKKYNLNDIYIKEINKFFKSKNLPTIFDVIIEKTSDEIVDTKNKKKKQKEKKLTKKELVKLQVEEGNLKKLIDKFISTLEIDKNFKPLSKNNLIDSLLNIVYWSLYILKNKSNEKVNIRLLFDCSISLYRAIHDCDNIIDNDLKEVLFKLLDKFETYIKSKESNSTVVLLEKYFELISDNSFWDKHKPNSISLYQEQIDVIRHIIDSISNDLPLMLFYWIPPANGKTLISSILARIVSESNKKITEQVNSNRRKGIPIDDLPKKKTILYICYNDIVRNSVSKLCLTPNIDIKFWLATHRYDAKNNDLIVDLRAYKNCYPDWRKRKTSTVDKLLKKNGDNKYSTDIIVQWKAYLYETRFYDDIEKSHVKDDFYGFLDYERADNIPEMVISDLDSANILLEALPDTFIVYFDEAFAAADKEVTARIMKNLPKISVFVSATLAEREQIPTIINYFKNKHELSNDDFIKYVKSDTQHISCEFISPIGNIISPHHFVETREDLVNFLELLERTPLIQRGYSNLIVYHMYTKLKDHLPSELELSNIFRYFGSLSNDKIREYGINILKFIVNNFTLFDNIRKIEIEKYKNTDKDKLFTNNSHYFSEENLLHVTNPSDFGLYVNEITENLLKDSPQLKNYIGNYQKSLKNIENSIANSEKNSKKEDQIDEISELKESAGSVKFNYDTKYIVNSSKHSDLYHGRFKVNKTNSELFDLSVIQDFDETYAKLFLSRIGIYNQSSMNESEMEIFLKYKDYFRFILSNPSITYGTNLNLTIVDIDDNMSLISTKNTLYQLIGRAGRKGKSKSASVFFRSWDIFEKIIDYDDTNIEANQIETNLLNIV